MWEKNLKMSFLSYFLLVIFTSEVILADPVRISNGETRFGTLHMMARRGGLLKASSDLKQMAKVS